MTAPIDQISLLLLLSAIVAIIARRARLPYTVGLVVTGVALAISGVTLRISLTRELLFLVFLPPLVFESAYHLKWEALRTRLVAIVTLATVGVGISAAVVTLGMHYFVHWSWSASALFGVLIAATDPVSVIATFKDAKVGGEPRLLVEAESLFNDGTAAVAYTAVIATITGQSNGVGSVSFHFALSIIGGIVFGSLVGAVSLFLAGKQDEKLVDITLTTVAAYGSFLVAERFHVSGVLATLTAGLMVGNMGHLGHLSEKSREAVESFWEYATFAVNSIVFLLIGFSVVYESARGLAVPIVLAVFLALLARAISVYLCCGALHFTRARVSYALQHVLVWGGLRGALGLALALGIPDSLSYAVPVRAVTFAVVAISIVSQGSTMTPLLKRLGFVRTPTEIKQ